jgi:excisionase family DNA binding protein
MIAKVKAERLAQSAGALVDIATVCGQLGVNRSTLHRWIKAGVWPAPDIAMGTRYRRYRQQTVDRALANMNGVPHDAN